MNNRPHTFNKDRSSQCIQQNIDCYFYSSYFSKLEHQTLKEKPTRGLDFLFPRLNLQLANVQAYKTKAMFNFSCQVPNNMKTFELQKRENQTYLTFSILRFMKIKNKKTNSHRFQAHVEQVRRIFATKVIRNVNLQNCFYR